MDDQLNYMVEQLGSMEKVIQYFKKNSEDEFRTELFDIIKTNKLGAEMQKKIIDGVEITPEETRNFSKPYPQENCLLLVLKWKLHKLL